MNKDRLIKFQREKIKEQEMAIDDLKKELKAEQGRCADLEKQIEMMKNDSENLRALHDETLQEYKEGMEQVQDIITKNKQAYRDAQITIQDYEKKMNVLLKRLRKEKDV